MNGHKSLVFTTKNQFRTIHTKPSIQFFVITRNEFKSYLLYTYCNHIYLQKWLYTTCLLELTVHETTHITIALTCSTNTMHGLLFKKAWKTGYCHCRCACLYLIKYYPIYKWWHVIGALVYSFTKIQLKDYERQFLHMKPEWHGLLKWKTVQYVLIL